MKKTFICSLLALCCMGGYAQDKAVKAELYGFVRNYFTYDSRSCVQSNEGLFNMLPNDINPGWGRTECRIPPDAGPQWLSTPRRG